MSESPSTTSRARVGWRVSEMAITPYVVGQWVRNERFYGRRDLIEEILGGNRNCLWILGTRRVGKTSILKRWDNGEFS